MYVASYVVHKMYKMESWICILCERRQVTKHTLNISRSLLQMYASNRRISDPDLLNDAMRLLASQADKRKIADMMKQHENPNFTANDLHNLNTERKKILGPEGVQLKEILTAFVARQGAVVKIVVDDDESSVQTLSWQSPFKLRATQQQRIHLIWW